MPTHFTVDGNALLVHLARPNPVWEAIEADPNVAFTVTGDYAFIPGPWRAKPDVPPTDGVPTSYYAAVQFTCRAAIVDEPQAKAELLRRQMAHFQPDGDHAPIAVDQPPYGRMLPGIRGLRLDVTDVRAKFKYDDHKPVEQRTDTVQPAHRARPGPGRADRGAAEAPTGPRRYMESLTPPPPARPFPERITLR